MKIKAKVSPNKIIALLLLLSCNNSLLPSIQTLDHQEKVVQKLLEDNLQPVDDGIYTIKKIIIQGNKHVKNNQILQSLTYKVGDIFDASLSGAAINNLYANGHFSQIELSAEVVGDKELELYVNVEEKKLLEDLKIKGNKAFKSSKIKEKLNLTKLATIDEEMLRNISLGIKKMYAEENRHFVEVETEIVLNEENSDKAVAHITVHEGTSSQDARDLGSKK